MLTTGQKRALHAAARRALGDQFDGAELEHMRRQIQRRIGGFHSAADRTATREGFIQVMAFYEELCARRGVRLERTGGHPAAKQRGGDPDRYWRDQAAAARPGDALRYRLRAEAARVGMDRAALDEFIRGPHMSGGACADVDSASPYWLRRCLEAIKAIGQRRCRDERPVFTTADVR